MTKSNRNTPGAWTIDDTVAAIWTLGAAIILLGGPLAMTMAYYGN